MIKIINENIIECSISDTFLLTVENDDLYIQEFNFTVYAFGGVEL